MPTTKRLALAAVALVTIGLASACEPKRYDVAEVIGTGAGLRNPWELAFLSDGTMFVTERAGDVGVKRPGGPYQRFNRPADVVESGEGGMMGLAIDPNFAANGRIYTCYLTTGDVRVVRWNANLATMQLSSPKPLITGIPRTSGRHSGCRLAFGPGGALFATTGDAARCEVSQSLTSLAGKVLRVDTENGNGVNGNIPGSNGQPSKIFAYGFRNPQGLSFNGNDGRPFITEHGPDRDDEITQVAAGGNGGWAPGCPYNEGVPMTDTRLPNVQLPTWQSGSTTIAVSGSDFVTDADWGDRKGQLAVAVLKGRQLRVFDVDSSPDGGTPVVEGYGRLRTAVEGPDGRLYVATDANPGRVLAIQPVL